MVMCVACSKPQSDAVMIDFYRSHKVKFQFLITNISVCTYRYKGVIANDDKQTIECRKLLDELKIQKILVNSVKGVAKYAIYQDGDDLFDDYAHQKTYIYTTQKNIGPLVESIDGNLNSIRSYQGAYILLDVNWYLYYDSLDG